MTIFVLAMSVPILWGSATTEVLANRAFAERGQCLIAAAVREAMDKTNGVERRSGTKFVCVEMKLEER